MTTETKPSDQNPRVNAKVDGVSRRTKRKRRCRETNMTMVRSPPVMFPTLVRSPPVMFPLQRLYLSCLEVFKGVGTVPSPAGDLMLRGILDGLMPEDIGLSRNLRFLDHDNTVFYTMICQCENFLLYALLLPENAVIPLHDHPEMTVFSKLLVGKVHIKSYDLVNPDVIDNPPPSSQLKLACLKEDGIFTAPCKTSVLYPTSGGNIHAFTAITPCAILDVVGPPFSKEDGRDCTYYRDVSHAIPPNENMLKKEEEGKGYRWLEEIEIPLESLKMDRMEYLGPEIIEVSQ
ncbi:putative cysteamine dioxygenase [Helianthus annuus]|uniref:cysteine dioxygenase n=13 Tax=Helianthus annuus TaxID=4232 RepID=A0A251SRI5_HELAN|nr:plant cysteine oxidase 2 [Helianthus annuus]KAF5772971.1 putative cysteamine dioxygenase [Helianthus annuus]